MLELVVAAQEAAEERLTYCYHLMAEADDAAEYDFDGPVSEPIAPFCGCNTCVVREVLDAAYPFLLLIAKDEVEG